jgi:hypothetical protein
MPDMTSVSSSHVHSVGYDSENSELHVKFKSGGTYVYKDVPQSEYDGLVNADSTGKYLQSNIVGVYDHRKG